MSNLLNRSAVKKFILAQIKAMRPGMEKQLTRVSIQALDDYEARLRVIIKSDIMTHPTLGKTFRTN